MVNRRSHGFSKEKKGIHAPINIEIQETVVTYRHFITILSITSLTVMPRFLCLY